jgi:DnaK suppressor protein
MDVQTVTKFKKLLLAERERLLNNSRETIKHEINVSTDDLPDEADLAASEITQSLTFELRNRERVMIAKINTALARIQEGSFGECDSLPRTTRTPRKSIRLNSGPLGRDLECLLLSSVAEMDLAK